MRGDRGDLRGESPPGLLPMTTYKTQPSQLHSKCHLGSGDMAGMLTLGSLQRLQTRRIRSIRRSLFQPSRPTMRPRRLTRWPSARTAPQGSTWLLRGM